MKKKITILMLLIIFTISGTFSPSKVSGAPLAPPYVTYFPMTSRGMGKSIFGGEIPVDATSFSVSWQKAADSWMYWTRRNGLLWSDIQPSNNGQWNWSAVSGLENELRTAGSTGIQTILTVRSTPIWAQKVTDAYCGPVRSSNLKDFANFLSQVVKRYSAAPYNILYYEIGNEPDVDPSLVTRTSLFGCWGDKNDAYYGGGYYADMLKVIYPAVKAANPQAQVVIGGLLMDCDPSDPGPNTGCKIQANKLPGMFFEGILKNGGGPYFDLVNFHGYPIPLATDTNPILLEKNHASWALRGGVVMGKINFLREIMAKYGVNKPIFQSEAALARDGRLTDFTVYERRKADYVVWVFARNMSQNILGTTWYTFSGPGWNNSGILGGNQEEIASYFAMKFAVKELGGGIYSAPVNSFAGVEGFEFDRGAGYKIWTLFSSDNNSPVVTLPAGYTAVYDTLGNPITPVGGQVTIDHPIYVEFVQ